MQKPEHDSERRMRRRLRRVPATIWLMAAVLVAGAASALLKGSVPDLVSPVRARAAAWTEAPKPQDSIWAAIDAAKAGNVAAYLERFGQPMRGQLEESRRELGEAGFRDYLVRTASQPKGIAVSLLENPEGPDAPRFRVEFIFQDRNEVQQYTLRRDGARWQISAVDGAERIKTLIPYGTPVQDVFGAR
jgi:hypothetical protein